MNEYNYGNSRRQGATNGYAAHRAAPLAVYEAMAWLHARGLVASKAEEVSQNIIFVTRRDHEALSRGLPQIRAVERVQENLHPLIDQRSVGSFCSAGASRPSS